jgi:uncharacterized RDD family membrane protein YckC
MKTPSSQLFASFWSRAFAFITDIFMIGLPISLIISALFGYDQTHSASGMDILLQNKDALKNPPNPLASILQIVLFMSITVMLWRYGGQTPGKKLARIAVVDANTLKPAPYWKLILRFIAYLVSAISLVGFFMGLFRKDNRALHDLISGTCVINKR